MSNREKLNLEDRIKEFLHNQTAYPVTDSSEPPIGKAPTVTPSDEIRFDIKPDEMIRYLKRYIVGQDVAIETLATKICTHFHRMKFELNDKDLPKIIGYVKSNVLMIGPTGVGKTYLIRLIANMLNVPFVKGDATKFSETGYVGGDVEDLVRELVHQANGNFKLAELGIIYIDEIDKIASSGSTTGPDVSRGGVQRNLLKLMEETEVDMKVPHDLSSQMEAMLETQRTGKASRKRINTKNILFIMSGAFVTLSEVIAQRLKTGGMGFTGEKLASNIETDYLLSNLHTQDLVKFGFEAEFIGRLPVITYMNELTEESLFEILRSKNSSVILSKQRDFAAYGIGLTFDEDVLRYIAKEAILHKTGARGLVTVIEKLLLPFENRLPSTNVKHLHLTMKIIKEVVKDRDDFFRSLVVENVVKEFADQYLKQTGIELAFSESALESLQKVAVVEKNNLKEVLIDKFRDFEFGLKLAGKNKLNITSKVIDNPKAYLDGLVKKSYKKQD